MSLSAASSVVLADAPSAVTTVTVAGGDDSLSSVPTIAASALTPTQFLQQYVQTNQPVILEGAVDAWLCGPNVPIASTSSAAVAPATAENAAAATTEAGGWTITRLQSILGNTLMHNVFISSGASKRRFKFFKSATATKGATTDAADVAASASASRSSSPQELKRAAMTFDEFVARSAAATAAAAADNDSSSVSDEAYYLYGEPMPASLAPHFPSPHILSSVNEPLTSTLLWVSPAPTISPLHYDLNFGCLCQVAGEKQVILAHPKYYEQLYPHAVNSLHDRQSAVDDIHQPDSARFPLAATVPLMKGTLKAGSLLFLPYGWWHQIESVGFSISVSMRWNPAEQALRQAATAWQRIKALPPPLRERMQTQLLDACGLPRFMQHIHVRRWLELEQSLVSAQ